MIIVTSLFWEEDAGSSPVDAEFFWNIIWFLKFYFQTTQKTSYLQLITCYNNIL